MTEDTGQEETFVSPLPIPVGFSWPQIVALLWAWMPIWDLALQLSQSFAYAVFVAIAYPALTIFGVTLLSLTYRFFAVPSEGRPMTKNAAACSR